MLVKEIRAWNRQEDGSRLLVMLQTDMEAVPVAKGDRLCGSSLQGGLAFGDRRVMLCIFHCAFILSFCFSAESKKFFIILLGPKSALVPFVDRQLHSNH